MRSVSTQQAAFTALDSADFDAASVGECVNLLSHTRRLQGWLHASEARLTSKLTEHHAAGQSAPAADSLTRTGGVSAAEARRKERRSKTINDSPTFGAALANGDIGAEHVDQLGAATVSLGNDVKAALLNSHNELLNAARNQTPEKFGRTVRNKVRALEADHGIERNRQQRKQTFISHRINHETGMHEGRFAFHPELGARIFSAIDRQVLTAIQAGTARGEAEFVNRTVDHNQLAAEALGDIVTTANINIKTLESVESNAQHDAADHGATAGSLECRAIEADITVIVDYATATSGEFHDHSVCETSYGADLPPASVQRLLCNGRITPIFVDANGNPFNLGRTVRHANRSQRRALRALYRSCGFPGCDVGFWRCEMHHILPWELGGPTDLTNLIPICSRHHHVVHEGGWQLHLAPDRTLTVTEPNGNTFGTARPDLERGTPRKRWRSFDETPQTDHPPPNNAPPSNAPRTNRPLSDQPPVDAPPIPRPLSDQPPVDAPPIAQPPIAQSPIAQPPIPRPPIGATTGVPPGVRVTHPPSDPSADSSNCSSARVRTKPPRRPTAPAKTRNDDYEQISILAT